MAYVFDHVSIIEQSVANGSLEGTLSCPPLPQNVKDLELPMNKTKHQPVVWLTFSLSLSLSHDCTCTVLCVHAVGEGIAGDSGCIVWSSTDPPHD